MSKLIPVYPPDQQSSPGGLVSDAPSKPIDIVVTRFRSTDRIDTGQHNGIVSNVALRIVGANEFRRILTISNEGAVDIYIGSENVTITSGFRIGVGKSYTLETGGEVYGITPSGVGVAHWLAEIEAG